MCMRVREFSHIRSLKHSVRPANSSDKLIQTFTRKIRPQSENSFVFANKPHNPGKIIEV